MDYSANRAYSFSLSDMAWSEETSTLPLYLYSPADIQLNDGFLSIGGKDTGSRFLSNSVGLVYKFREDKYEWELQNYRLDVTRSAMSATAVPDTFLDCD